MPNTAILFGRLLIVLGIIGYGYGIYSGNASPTALIPAIFGLILMVLGHLSNAKENLRKHLMHVAVLVGLVGFIIPLWRLISKVVINSVSDINGSSGMGAFGGSFNFATFMLLAMALLCLAFVVLCVKSFIDARRTGSI